jgi:hypothetical protein
MNTAKERAQKIRRRYQLKKPCDIERVMYGENIHVVRFPFPGRLQEMIVANWVAIRLHSKICGECMS